MNINYLIELYFVLFFCFGYGFQIVLINFILYSYLYNFRIWGFIRLQNCFQQYMIYEFIVYVIKYNYLFYDVVFFGVDCKILIVCIMGFFQVIMVVIDM